jgi:hypothetical protein
MFSTKDCQLCGVADHHRYSSANREMIPFHSLQINRVSTRQMRSDKVLIGSEILHVPLTPLTDASQS